jgi:hypothetical protein
MLLANILHNQFWYLLPLLVTVSLVYGATRHELMQPILVHAYKSAVWMVSFMFTVFAVLWVLSWLLG